MLFIFFFKDIKRIIVFFFFSSRRRHTRWNCDWSSDVCSSDLGDKAFCAGGDIKELEHLRSEADAAAMAHRMRAILDRIPQLAIPVIAGLNGDALGGGAELAIACDF